VTDHPPIPEPQQPPAGSGEGVEVWAIIVRTLPDDIPGAVRMRRWLKLALRSYRLKVESIGERLPDVKVSPGVEVKKVRKPRARRPRPPADLIEAMVDDR